MVIRLACLFALATAACSFSGAEAGGTDAAVSGDANADASSDAAPATCSSFANGVALGFIKPADVALTSGGAYEADFTGIIEPTVVTISDGLDEVGVGAQVHTFMSTEMIVVEVGRFEIAAGSSFRMIGDRPIVLLSHTDIVIDGLLDVGGGCRDTSPNQTCAGPGGGVGPTQNNQLPTGCSPGQNGDGALGATPEHGGGGGGFGTAGASGGGNTAGAGGPACPDVDLEPLIGGSSGGAGGAGANGGDGGGGGGAIQLSAAGSVTLMRSTTSPSGINAGGGGGGESEANDAGGGGGSGGGILVMASSISIGADVVLAANGGGGGGGGVSGTENGQDGQLSDAPAQGGDGGRVGGAGAAGTSVAMVGAGAGNNDNCGGGGGGVGVIQLRAPRPASVENAGVISPEPAFLVGCEPE